jgi:rhomboid protease GluP
MSSERQNEEDDLSPVLRRFDDEFGQRRQPEPEPEPIYGEAQQIPQQRGYRVALPLGRVWAVWVLLALNSLIFAVPELLGLLGVRIGGLSPSDFALVLGAKDNQAIAQGGQYYRFLTSMFLHAGLLHIGFNAYALYALGPQAERVYGTARFLALYFIAGFSGGVASYALNPSPGVGASGAIFGLIGGLAAFYYVARGVLGEVSRQQLGSLITVIMINLFIGFSSPIIDNTAHIGGLIGGAAVGWMLAPRFELDERLYPPEIARRSWPLAWPGALGFLALLVILVMVINPPIR